MPTRKRAIQIAIVAVVQVITLMLMPLIITGLTIEGPGAALLVAIMFTFTQAIFWWVFIRFFAWLPAWLYPILTFVLTGALVMFFSDAIPGVTVANVGTGIWITIILTAVNAILSAILSLDVDEQFDRNVTRKLVERRGKPTKTDVPGFVFLEIDGLGEALFRRALAEGHMPTLKRWIDDGTHTIVGWETDYSAQTGAMQSGILMGNNDDMPAYRWWDRDERRIVMSGKPQDARAIEARLSSGRGLMSDGGTSRGNMFSGDATESTLTFSTILDRAQTRSPGFYLFLFSPYVVARLITRFLVEVFKEWYQQVRQKLRKDKYKYSVSARNPVYAFIRAAMGPLLQDLTTYTVISDMLRGVPAIYALYPGYDDVGHFAGMQTPEAFEMLVEADRYFARVEKALEYTPRPYHLVVLSDHGQSEGPTFKAAHGLSLEDLVKGLVKDDKAVLALVESNEAWDNVNAFLTESVSAESRTANLARTMLRTRTKDGVVEVGPKAEEEAEARARAAAATVVVMGSGCTGLIYFNDSATRMTYEQIQERYPELVLGLSQHPGIGFVMVQSEKDGAIVVGKGGVYFLDTDTFEGINPIASYGPNAALHLKRESSFTNCPDLVVNSRLDPDTGELCGFENQVSHHGGLGGPQNHAFVLYPTALPGPTEPIIGATGVYRLLRGWRDLIPAEAVAPGKALA